MGIAFGAVFFFAIVIFLFVAFNMFQTFRGRGVFGAMMERAERMQREQREHELRMAELAAEGRRPWTCTHCDSRNDAAAAQCDGCGAPREDEDHT